MIINFKIFEELTSNLAKVFWVVDHDEYFDVRLFKIGMNVGVIEKFKKMLIKNLDDGARHYYFGYNPDTDTWSYDDYNYVSGSNSFVSSFYKYMGHVEINEEDKQNYDKAKKDYEDELYFREVLKKGDVKKFNI